VSKRDAKVCVRIAGSGRAAATSTVTTWSSVTGQILALREHLAAEQVTLVVLDDQFQGVARRVALRSG